MAKKKPARELKYNRVIHEFDDDGNPVEVELGPPPPPGKIDPRRIRIAVNTVWAKRLEAEGRMAEAAELRAESEELRAELGL